MSIELNDELPSGSRPTTAKERAVASVENSQYRLAFRQLCGNYPAAKKALAVTGHARDDPGRSKKFYYRLEGGGTVYALIYGLVYM